MTFGSNVARTATNAVAADCARLWSTLTGEFCEDLQLLIEPRFREDGTGAIWIGVVNESLVIEHGSPMKNIWAEREFSNQLYLISVGQLFDLLIVAYKKLDEYFANGEPSAPVRRVM